MIVHEKGIKDSWKEYMERVMNEENEWDHGISDEVKEGPADCFRICEVAAALKKMKRRKAPGLSGLTAEMIQATEGIGIRQPVYHERPHFGTVSVLLLAATSTPTSQVIADV